jgi:F0F1-type ATP synthase epsilon subunit|tara:strand:+ start:3027 stop:3509 length:483 start_codon:yes stop_codon:yes gene_type:complete
MLFLLATPEYNNIQSNTTKVRVHLRNGVAEIFDQHQDLMGKIDNNIIEIETNFENKTEKVLFVLQDAVFIVSNQGLDVNSENKGTGVYVYAKRVKEITPKMSLNEITTQWEQKKLDLEQETKKLGEDKTLDKNINSKIFVLKDEIQFLEKVTTVVKDLKS